MDKSCEKESIKNVDVLISRNNDGSLHFAEGESMNSKGKMHAAKSEREKKTRHGMSDRQKGKETTPHK